MTIWPDPKQKSEKQKAMLTEFESQHLLDMERFAKKQVIATLAAALILARSATDPGAIKSAWDDASRIAFPPRT